jgi:hypothetical protein
VIKLKENPIPKQGIFVTQESFSELSAFLVDTYGVSSEQLHVAMSAMIFTLNTCHQVIETQKESS